MHFFKYGAQGEVLAIVLPTRVQKSAGVKEGDEYEFLEVAPGAFLLVGKQASTLSKGALVGKIAEKLFENGGAQGKNGGAQSSENYPDFKPATEIAATASPTDASITATASSPTSKNAVPMRVSAPSYPPTRAVTSSYNPAKRTGEKAFWEQKIDLQGYAIVEEANTQTVSQQLEMRVKKGEVVGIKGFDKKLYICERGFYQSLCAKIQQAELPKEFSTSQAAEATKTVEGACLAVLNIMKEGGEVMEKKKGMFKLVK